MGTCERILLVEDEPDLRELTAEIIEGTGVKVERCSDAQAALEHLRRGARPDLILLDLSLPSMSGSELLDLFRGDPAWRTVPVVAMSGFPEARFPGLRVDAFMRKPFDIAGLERLISRLCGTTSSAAAVAS